MSEAGTGLRGDGGRETLITRNSDVLTAAAFDLQEPTDSLEETLLLSQPDFSLGAENGSEEAGNPSGPHTDNPINHSPDNARAYPFCTQCFPIALVYLSPQNK